LGLAIWTSLGNISIHHLFGMGKGDNPNFPIHAEESQTKQCLNMNINQDEVNTTQHFFF